MKPGHTPDSRHGHAAEDCTSRWSGLRRLGAAALIAATAAGALAGCAGAKADADDGRHAAAEENSLPPGVMPPNDPPQPGDAPLGPDGHYDYSAPGFALKNPCDTEYFQRALELGWRVPEFGTKRRDEPEEMYCGVINDEVGLALFSFSSNFVDFDVSEFEVKVTEHAGVPLIILKRPSLFGEACFAGVETPNGMIGGLSGTGGFSLHTTIEQACDEATQSIVPILGVNQ